MKHFQKYFPPLGIFFLALLVRLIYNLTSASNYIAKDDASLYNHIAYNIVYQHCFCIFPNHPEISRAPLWPLLLSIFYRFTPRPSLQLMNSGVQVFYGRLLYCFIGSFTCVLVYLLARDLFGKRIALISGIIAALYAGLFIYDGWIYSESLYTFLLTAFIYSLYRLQRTAQRRWIILSGLFLGMANLTRPNGPILFGMLFLWAIGIVLAKVLSWQTVVKSILAITCIATVVIAPWTYRNYLVSHSFVLVSIGTGDVLLGVYNDTVLRGTTGLWTGSGAITPRPDLPQVVLKGKDTAQYTVEDDQIATNYALHWIRMHWRDMPRLLGYHLINMWAPFTSIEHGLPFREFPGRLSSQVVWYMTLLMPIPIFLLAYLGLFVTWRYRKKQLLIVYIVIALTILENLAFWGNMRFRAPIEPLLVLLAGGVLWWFTDDEPAKLRNRRKAMD
jgi:4-amino-4-deoxy-L-arabinose transferase-like glycosyltransferase